MLNLHLIHLNWRQFRDGREDVIERLISSYNCTVDPHYSENLDNATIDCILIHDSQEEDRDAVKAVINNRLQAGYEPPPFWVSFGGTVSYSSHDSYGCICELSSFLQNAIAFFDKWQSEATFPGWDYLVGKPELECALELLHRLLPATYGKEPLDTNGEWSKLNKLKNIFCKEEGGSDLASVWSEAEKAYELCISHSTTGDPITLLTSLREALLGNSSIHKQGLVSTLSGLRKANS